MNKNSQLINDRYEALMFAKSPEGARKAGRELVRVVLGDQATAGCSLEEGLRQVCRVFRPSADAKEQVRFENELIELAIWPNAQTMAA
ncbi:MAG: hypothetical protein WB992_06530 [Bryobacteraceae bacterium]